MDDKIQSQKKLFQKQRERNKINANNLNEIIELNKKLQNKKTSDHVNISNNPVEEEKITTVQIIIPTDSTFETSNLSLNTREISFNDIKKKYHNNLKEKYTSLLITCEANFLSLLMKYDTQDLNIAQYVKKHILSFSKIMNKELLFLQKKFNIEISKFADENKDMDNYENILYKKYEENLEEDLHYVDTLSSVILESNMKDDNHVFPIYVNIEHKVPIKHTLEDYRYNDNTSLTQNIHDYSHLQAIISFNTQSECKDRKLFSEQDGTYDKNLSVHKTTPIYGSISPSYQEVRKKLINYDQIEHQLVENTSNEDKIINDNPTEIKQIIDSPDDHKSSSIIDQYLKNNSFILEQIDSEKILSRESKVNINKENPHDIHNIFDLPILPKNKNCCEQFFCGCKSVREYGQSINNKEKIKRNRFVKNRSLFRSGNGRSEREVKLSTTTRHFHNSMISSRKKSRTENHEIIVYPRTNDKFIELKLTIAMNNVRFKKIIY